MTKVNLSVIIVNYNVKHFLEQCLHSVRKASQKLAIEIFVVDNNSVDGSAQMVQEKFPEVKVIANQKNTGFSFANNQAIKQSTGEYILLLNPDTVVEEETFVKTVAFMDSKADAGGLGVMMLDGKGNFLPESKRGLPTPSVAFYKIFGLSALLPKSKTFGRYHLGYLDKTKTHEIEVLSGAFMLLRKTVLDKTGLLDEDFFMYGEDIDLSYRIIKAGYKNYYYPETRIIHYKGESTKKSSVNYVFVFYNAMIIFARKHFSQNNAQTFAFLINLAIYFRAGVAILMRFAKSIALPAFDAIILFTGFYFIKQYYEVNIKFTGGTGSYPPELIRYVAPAYIITWLISVYYSGGYDKPLKLSKITRGIFAGTALILIAYALLPESLRFSRALVLFGAAWALVWYSISRMALHFTGIKSFALDGSENKRIIIVGNTDECTRVNNMLGQIQLKPGFIAYVTPHKTNEVNVLGSLDQLSDVIQIYSINEVIFCAKDIPANTIIDLMSRIENKQVEFKIAPPESLSIIGSNSINTSGELYAIDVNAITKPSNIRSKRLLDVLLSLFFTITLPVHVFLVKQPFGFIKNIVRVLSGIRSWVGYATNAPGISHLPKIKNGIVSPSDILSAAQITPETSERLNMLYAKDYKTFGDVNLVMKAYRKLGN